MTPLADDSLTMCIDCTVHFPGIGVAMIIRSFLKIIYYNVIIAWALRYLCDSFSTPFREMTASRGRAQGIIGVHSPRIAVQINAILSQVATMPK